MTLHQPQVGLFKPKKAARLKEKKSPGEKRKELPGNSEKHLAALRTLPCCIPGCNKIGGQVHHLKATGLRGIGLKSPDKYGLPMCNEHHIHGVERVGSKNELAWFEKHGIEALELAAALWMVSPDKGAMVRIVLAHKQVKR
jgi:hypothetical protein